MRTTIPARLFGDGAAPTGVPAELVIESDRIEVHAGDRVLTSAIADLAIREAGFGRDTGFELAWHGGEGANAVQVLGREHVRALRETPAFARSPQMQAWSHASRRRSIGRTLGWVAIGTIVLLPLLLIVLFISQADRIAALLVSEVPIEQEIQLGRSAFAAMRSTLSLHDGGAAHEAVNELGTRLSRGSKYQYEFYVADDATINAFALPGGIIVVHDGLIAATRRPEELAGVLAHEIQHVEQRHSLRGAFKALGLRGVWMLMTGDVGGTMLGQAALELTSRKFSREDESSADAKALETLVAHGIDPSGMVDFFTTMARENRTSIPELLSTHPADAARQKKLREKLERIESKSFQPLMLGAWPPEA